MSNEDEWARYTRALSWLAGSGLIFLNTVTAQPASHGISTGRLPCGLGSVREDSSVWRLGFCCHLCDLRGKFGKQKPAGLTLHFHGDSSMPGAQVAVPA